MRIPARVGAIELPQFDLLNDLAARWRARGADVINLGQAVPGFLPPPFAIEAFKQALDDPSAHVYSADAGIIELRTALARSLEELGGAVDPRTEIIITAGGNQAFQLAMTTLVDAGDEVILPAPYFLNHEMAVRAVGGVPIEAPLDAASNFTATWDQIAERVTPATRAIVLVSPSNPTGAVIRHDQLQNIVMESARREILTIVDETYMRFVYDGAITSAAAVAEWRKNLVIVGSFSKSYAVTGWRCGYLIANREIADEALKIQDCMVICAPVPVQKALAAVLKTEPNYTARWLPELEERREFAMRALGVIPGCAPIPPAGGFFVMVRVAGNADSRRLAADLVDATQVVTVPGRYFGNTGEGYLRISYGASTIDRLRDACERLHNYFRRD